MDDNKDYGWELLNSDKDDLLNGSGSYHGADGSYGNRYSDGSGSYHGADGSYCDFYSDGSASYHGADGSYGYRYSDGSVNYHGADGSYGDRYSDGSASYRGADGSYGDRYSDGSGSYHGADGSYCDFYSDGSASYRGADGSYGNRYSDGSGSYRGADGSYGDRYSDGSGSYRGADGSYSHRYSDGSGSYRGADGSYCDFYSDGSASYHGADGSYGYRYSDGSGSYRGADGSYGDCYSNGSASYHSVDDSYFYHDSDITGKKGERRHTQSSSPWIAILVVFLLSFLILGFIVGCRYYLKYKEAKNSIEVSISSDYLIGKNHTEVHRLLENAGFTDIIEEEAEDLSITEKNHEGIVSLVSIDGDTLFEPTSKYPYYAQIKIIYHVVKNINTPLSAKAAKEMDYRELEKQLRNAGFINIVTTAEYDLVTGWIIHDGSVKSITIDGNDSFKESVPYKPDVEIVITYHTFFANKDK